MDDSILQFLTRGVFVLVFGLTLFEFLRRRDLAHLEVAALFGGFALLILLQVVGNLRPAAVPEWASRAALLLFLAQPLILLRVLGQFRPVPRLQRILGIVGLLVSWVLVVVFP